MARQDGKTMSGLSPDARAILDSARNSDDPTDEQCERVRLSLLATVIAAGAAPLTATSTAAALALKVVIPIAFVLTGAVGAGVWWYARHGSVPALAPAAETSSAAAPTPTALAPISSVSPAVDVAKAVNVTRARRTTPSSEARATLTAPHNRLEEETKLLGQVNEALRAGDPLAAQALLYDYDQR